MLHATPATCSAPRGGDETDGFVPFGDTHSKLYEWLTMTYSDIFAAPAPVIVFVAPAPVVEHRALDPAVHEGPAPVVEFTSISRCSWRSRAPRIIATCEWQAWPRRLMTRPRTIAATASVLVTLHVVSAHDAQAAPALAVESVAPAPVITNIEQLMEPPVLHIQEQCFEVAKIIPQEP